MRLALIVGSAYETNGKLTPIPSAELDGDLVERRLSEPDAGFKVIRFVAERGLAERIEQRLLAQTEPIEQLMVYFSGYSVLSEERGPALLLDGDRLGTFSLNRLKNLFAHFAPVSCLIVDAAAVVDAGQGLGSVVDAIGQTLTESSESVSALVAVRNSALPDSFGGSAFTGLVLMVLDWLAASREPGQVVDLRWLFEGMRADEQLWKEIPAAGLFGGPGASFPILPARDTMIPGSDSALGGSPLPSFELSGPGSELDELLGLSPPAHQAEEPKTQPGVAPFDDSDEVTPTFRAPRAASGAPSTSDGGALPSFDLPPSAEDVPGGALPSFADVTEPTASDPASASEPTAPPVSEPTAPPVSEPTSPSREPALSPSDAAAPSPPAEASTALPTFGASTSADELAEAGKDEDASREFEGALALSDEPHERAGLLARFARVLARLGQGQVAAARFGEAVALEPLHVDVLAVRAEWADAASDSENLLHASQAWLEQSPEDPRALRFLARASEDLEDVGRALDAWCRLGRHHALPVAERALAFGEASRIVETKLEDRELAEQLAEEALALSPSPQNLGRAEELLKADGRHSDLFAHFERALSIAKDEESITRLCTELERLARQQLKDPARAARALELVLERTPRDFALRDRVIELFREASLPLQGLEHCRVAARLSPIRADSYRKAQSLFEAAGVSDGVWNAASVLECLGEADINESLLVSQHKPDGLLAARATIADADWAELLFSEAHDSAMTRLLDALGPAAVRVGIGFAKHKNRYFVPDPATLQDPEKSTTMLAKTLAWTSRLLGLVPPSVYVSSELSTGFDVAPTEQASTLVSRSLGSGLGLGQLAFLWGRHLPRFRSEFRAVPFFKDTAELSLLLTAGLALGGAAGIEVRELDGDAKRLYAALRREVRGPQLETLRDAARELTAVEVNERAAQVLREIELIGVRAGLLASGDVGAAADLIRRFPNEGVTNGDDQLGELYAFSISEQYQVLRRKIGVAVAA
jgi:tetratricopeptide (TPR) repeat protein